MNLDRHGLYLWIWKRSITRVAATLGVDRKSVSKWCTKFKIPAPPRGTHRRRERGYAVAMPPLQPADVGAEFARPLTQEQEQLFVEACGAEAHGYMATEQEPALVTGRTLTTSEQARARERKSDAARMSPVSPEPAKQETADAGLSVPPRLGAMQAHVLKLVRAAARHQYTEHLLARLDERAAELEPPVAAVLLLYSRLAKMVVDDLDPVEQLTKECAGIVLGTDLPQWWVDVERATGLKR